jgi:hypothetical protein
MLVPERRFVARSFCSDIKSSLFLRGLLVPGNAGMRSLRFLDGYINIRTLDRDKGAVPGVNPLAS